MKSGSRHAVERLQTWRLLISIESLETSIRDCLRVAVIALLLSSALSAEKSSPRDRSVKDVMASWVGHWVSRGDPDAWHADSECQWSRDYDFIVCDQLLNDKTRQLLIISFDEPTHTYRMTSLGLSREPVIQTATVKGKIWTVNGTFVEAGKTYLIRGTTDFSEPDVYHDRQEHSEDGGAHWIEDRRGRGQKTPLKNTIK